MAAKWASTWPNAVRCRRNQRRWKRRHELPKHSPYRIRKEREKVIQETMSRESKR